MLEALKGIKEIGGHEIVDINEFAREFGDDDGNVEWVGNYPMAIDFDKNVISFRIQKGQIRDVGVNGCQIDTMVEAVVIILQNANKTHPCKENLECINHLHDALHSLQERTSRRTRQGIEGTSKEDE